MNNKRLDVLAMGATLGVMLANRMYSPFSSVSATDCHNPSDLATAASDEEMSELDKRMLKYFKSYYYVPPIRKDGIVKPFPAKECGSSPDYDEFFTLDKKQRSANNEDRWIYNNLFLGKNTTTGGSPGTYVEIGAFNGMHESNSRFFEACLGWEGLLVEGQPANYNGVLRDRPLAHKMSFAPSCDTEYEEVIKTIQFHNYPRENSGLRGHAKTYDKQNVVEADGGNPWWKHVVDVPCGPFGPVLEDVFAGKQINFFSLDVEGSERLVLDTIDFSRIKIDVLMIEIENAHCDALLQCEVRERVREKMAEEGYLRYENLVPKSDVYVHPESSFQLPATSVI